MIGKYVQGKVCDWCLRAPAQAITVSTRRGGVSKIAWKVEAMACDVCKRRLEEQSKDD